MSNTCGNCDCSDKSQCVKKGSSNTMVIETEKRYISLLWLRFQLRIIASAELTAAAPIAHVVVIKQKRAMMFYFLVILGS
ncbi:hypothetical protein V6Z12_A01G065400 [Gossypium hirsutum]